MRTLERLRNTAFWIIDRCKGGAIRSQLEDIDFIMSNWESEVAKQKQMSYLNNILQYAIDNIDFYSKMKQGSSLSDFPIINKNIIRENESLFLNKKYEKSKLFRQATSGSTGTPFEVYQDKIKRTRATADTLFFSQFANYTLGNRLYFSRVWESGTERSKLTQLIQNWITHDSSHLSDDDIKDLIESLEKDKSTKNVLLFASTLSAIAKYIERYDIYPKTKVESFITVSESLDLTIKEVIQKRFGAPVVSRYSDQELGIMAQQCFLSNEFHLNVASFYFEILDLEEDKPVEPGIPGRIVVTDLFNHSMPLIRYDTGDIAVIQNDAECAFKTPVLERVEGRRVDFIFDTNGNPVSPYAINSPMHVFMEIQQYQFIQEDKDHYVMLLNMQEGHSFERETEMLDMLKSYLGKDAMISVEYVDEIPILKSGKRKQVVNNYRKI